MTESILQEAERLINGERAVFYGPPKKNFKNIADLWTGWLGWEISPLDVGVMMILMKVARLQEGYHRDSVVDIAGYAGTIEKLGLEALAAPSGAAQAVVPLPADAEPVVQPVSPNAQKFIDALAAISKMTKADK